MTTQVGKERMCINAKATSYSCTMCAYKTLPFDHALMILHCGLRPSWAVWITEIEVYKPLKQDISLFGHIPSISWSSGLLVWYKKLIWLSCYAISGQ